MRRLLWTFGSVALLVAAAFSNNFGLSLLSVAVAAETAPATKTAAFSPYVDAQGNISFPEGFRTSMVHLGSWFAPAGDASGFHDVYTEASTVEAFRKTGKYPDGATLVKELRASDSGTYTTGADVSHSTDGLKQWFVMVKDTKGRFEKNPLWGEGWGWALFKPDDRTTNLASNYQTDCLGCHVPAKNKDWIYTEAYPILSE